jgi:hypothetical protein
VRVADLDNATFRESVGDLAVLPTIIARYTAPSAQAAVQCRVLQVRGPLLQPVMTAGEPSAPSASQPPSPGARR